MSDPPDQTGALIRTDLRNIMLAQEAYRVEHGGYATDYDLLQRATGLRLHPGNVALVLGEQSGFKASVRSDGRGPVPTQYSVYVGAMAEVEGKLSSVIYKDP